MDGKKKMEKKKTLEAERWESGIFVVNRSEKVTTVHLIIKALLIIKLHVRILWIGSGGLSATLLPSLLLSFSLFWFLSLSPMNSLANPSYSWKNRFNSHFKLKQIRLI